MESYESRNPCVRGGPSAALWLRGRYERLERTQNAWLDVGLNLLTMQYAPSQRRRECGDKKQRESCGRIEHEYGWWRIPGSLFCGTATTRHSNTIRLRRVPLQAFVDSRKLWGQHFMTFRNRAASQTSLRTKTCATLRSAADQPWNPGRAGRA